MRILAEDNLPAVHRDTGISTNVQSTQHFADTENVRQVLAQCLDMDPEDIEVGLVPDKLQDMDPEHIMGNLQTIMDYLAPGKTGDVWAKFDVGESADRVAQTLQGMGFLEDIEVNGQSGDDLSAIVSDGTELAGNLVITSKNTEAELIPFMRYMGMMSQGNDDGGFEDYWRQIGGKVIGQESIERMQQNMAISAGIRGGRQLGGRAMRALPGRR